MKITTATGKDFPTKWFGTSTIDGAFRAHLVGETMNTAFAVFANPTETEKIYLSHDSMTPPEELLGYTTLQGITAETDGVVISLKNR